MAKAKTSKTSKSKTVAKRKTNKDGLTAKDVAYRALYDNRKITAEDVQKLPGLSDLSLATIRTWLGWWRRELRDRKPFLTGRSTADPEKAVTTIPKASREYGRKPRKPRASK